VIRKILLIIFLLIFFSNYLSSEEITQNNKPIKHLINFKFGNFFYDAVYYHIYNGKKFSRRHKLNLLNQSILFEYNFIFRSFIMGIGLDVQSPVEQFSQGEIIFFIPYISMKYMLTDQLYFGTSVSYRLGDNAIISYDEVVTRYRDERDLWVNGHIGVLLPFTSSSLLNIEIKSGYNLTNKQWQKYTTYDYSSAGEPQEGEKYMDYTYDYGFIIGFLFKI
jgi:hypothetical protein